MACSIFLIFWNQQRHVKENVLFQSQQQFAAAYNYAEKS
jgi:hypothetical protein